MMNNLTYTKSKGLTLIEVLIALAIIAIAMTAVIKATSQTIRGTRYLQTKMVAMWIGENLMNEVRVGLRRLPDPPDQLQEKIKVFDQEWYTTANSQETPNKSIKQIFVHVYEQNPESDPQSVVDLVSYVYVAKK